MCCYRLHAECLFAVFLFPRKMFRKDPIRSQSLACEFLQNHVTFIFIYSTNGDQNFSVTFLVNFLKVRLDFTSCYIISWGLKTLNFVANKFIL